MYLLIQNVAKFRLKCAKYKMDFCPELKSLVRAKPCKDQLEEYKGVAGIVFTLMAVTVGT